MIVRVERVAWTLFHLDDLDADFARFYRRDWWEHSGPQFFARAARVAAYGGVVAARLQEQARETDPEPEQEALPDILDALDARDMAGLVEVG